MEQVIQIDVFVLYGCAAVVVGFIFGWVSGWYIGFHSALDGFEKENKRLKECPAPGIQERDGRKIINDFCIKIEKDMKYPAADRDRVCEWCNEAYADGEISGLSDEVRQEWIKDHLWLGYIVAAEERGE